MYMYAQQHVTVKFPLIIQAMHPMRNITMCDTDRLKKYPFLIVCPQRSIPDTRVNQQLCTVIDTRIYSSIVHT